MKKAKFIQDAKLDPARFYRNPADIMRDRRLTDADRRQIIAVWERKVNENEGFAGEAQEQAQEQLEKLRQLRQQLDRAGTIADNQLQRDETPHRASGF